ncbi:hypothetical protein M0R45_028609 [Rubus argutus]|uniref:Pentatricopeptide repeat-containing protein n=1 Tax=Rubus argutus TaxID=59490 RepID=A0AAW1W7X3_RUBAR
MRVRFILYRRYCTSVAISSNSQISRYARLGQIENARKVFDQMPERTTVSWNSMVAGYFQNNQPVEARNLFDRMQLRNLVSWNGLISGYIKNGMLSEARKVFDSMPERNVVSWTSMVRGYVQEGNMSEAESLFWQMPGRNIVSWTVMLGGLIQEGRVDEARRLYDLMPEKDVVARTSMIGGYFQVGRLAEAREIFDEMPRRNVVSWTMMISGLASLDHGRQIHAQLVRNQFDLDVYVASVLITMYVKCGNLVKAKQVFDRFNEKDIVMWNSIITGYAQHGLGEEALQVFQEMCSLGMAPDDITFIGVLSACSYSGKVEQGHEVFETMKSKYQVEPRTAHYACMVDLLGRAGRVEEAMDLIENMPVDADAIVWGALLSACRTYMKLDLAEVAAKKLIQLEPNNAGHYVLLSNIYASRVDGIRLQS